jgi:hypothetical protein
VKSGRQTADLAVKIMMRGWPQVLCIFAIAVSDNLRLGVWYLTPLLADFCPLMSLQTTLGPLKFRFGSFKIAIPVLRVIGIIHTLDDSRLVVNHLIVFYLILHIS